MASVLFNFIKTMNWKHVGLIEPTLRMHTSSVWHKHYTANGRNEGQPYSLTILLYRVISHSVQVQNTIVSLSAEATVE